jgi:hypothetical protein
MIDHQIDWNQGIGPLGIGPHVAQRVAHRAQIHHAGNSGEILQQHARRAKIDFLAGGADLPFRDVLDVGRLHRAVIFTAQ